MYTIKQNILCILYIIAVSVSANFGCHSAFWAWICELFIRCSTLAMVFVLQYHQLIYNRLVWWQISKKNREEEHFDYLFTVTSCHSYSLAILLCKGNPLNLLHSIDFW